MNFCMLFLVYKSYTSYARLHKRIPIPMFFLAETIEENFNWIIYYLIILNFSMHVVKRYEYIYHIQTCSKNWDNFPIVYEYSLNWIFKCAKRFHVDELDKKMLIYLLVSVVKLLWMHRKVFHNLNLAHDYFFFVILSILLVIFSY